MRWQQVVVTLFIWENCETLFMGSKVAVAKDRMAGWNGNHMVLKLHLLKLYLLGRKLLNENR